MSPEDQQIVQSIRQGDRDAFQKLFRHWYPLLVGFARRFIPGTEDTEEIVQDLFVQLWDRRDQLAPTTSLRSYLFTAVRNRCFNFLQHQKVRQQSQEAIAERLEEQGRQSNPAEHLEQQELEQRILAAIQELPERCRKVFYASRFEGKKYKEIAAEMDISPRTVEVQVGKALKHLRKALKDILPLIIWWLSMGGIEK